MLSFYLRFEIRSPSGESDAFSAEYKSKGNGINYFKLIRQMNLNKLVVAHLNIHSIRNKFEGLIKNVSGEVGLLTVLSLKKYVPALLSRTQIKSRCARAIRFLN